MKPREPYSGAQAWIAASQLPKHIELSNVNITEELINSIEDQRQYEINIKMISSASELDEAGTSLMRLPG